MNIVLSVVPQMLTKSNVEMRPKMILMNSHPFAKRSRIASLLSAAGEEAVGVALAVEDFLAVE